MQAGSPKKGIHMSRLSLTMKSLLAIGAATALTITASADEPKTKPEITEDAKAMVAGSGAGKATFKDLSVTAKGGGDDDEFEWQQGDVESEGDIALNVPVAAPNDKLGPIKGESQDRVKAAVSDGEDRLTENISIDSGVEGEVLEDAKDAAEKTDPPKEIGPLRTRPMQRR